MAERPLLIIGAGGQIGSHLVRVLSRLGPVVAPNRAELDLLCPQQVRRFIHACRPAVVINSAAYTAVDAAEDQPAIADAINHLGVAAVGEAARRIAAPVIHYSTDYVFDGAGTRPWTEIDPPRPLSAYGAGKLAGEQALAAGNPQHIILRTSGVYSEVGNNFVLAILKRCLAGDILKVVNDQCCAPTPAALVAGATGALLRKLQRGAEYSVAANLAGVYHLSCGGQTTWHGFAESIIEEFGPAQSDGLPLRTTTAAAITSGDYGAKARRPAYSVLSNQKIREAFGISLPDWRIAFRDWAAQMRAGELPLRARGQRA